MSIIASRVTITVPLVLDGQTCDVTVQKLSGRHLAKAQQAFFDELVRGIAARGGAAVQKDIQLLFEKDPEGTKKGIEAVKADPLNGFDKHTLILYGVRSWTYPETIPADIDAKRAFFDELDGDTVDALAREVMKLTKPKLFQTEDEAAADQKNG